MKYRLIAFVVLSLQCVFLQASESASENENLEAALVQSMHKGDWVRFDALLEQGADPYSMPGDKNFQASALCQSTARGAAPFFVHLVEWGADLSFVGSGATPTPLTCAIHYRNMGVYLELLDIGVDPDQIVNPQDEKHYHQTAFDYAIEEQNFDFAWDLVKRSEISDEEVAHLVRVLETQRHVQGHPKQLFRYKLTDWLRSHGIAVNPLSDIVRRVPVQTASSFSAISAN